MTRFWVGVDVGKATIIGKITRRTRGALWAVDINNGPAALLLALLIARDTDVRYVPSSLAAQMAAAFNGERKTDAKDAAVIANTVRIRPDLPRITATDAVQAQLQLLTARRGDLVNERIRSILRLQQLLAPVSPAVERALDVTLRGPVHILTQWQTPAMIRKAGLVRIEAMPRGHKVSNAAALARNVVAAARAQRVTVTGEATAAAIIAEMADDLQSLNRRIDQAEKLLDTTLAQHELAEVVTSLPGMGVVLASEFLAVAGTLDNYRSASPLAAHAGLTPTPRDSGRVRGNEHRPKRYPPTPRVQPVLVHRDSGRCPDSRTYYDRKKAEGNTHRQTLAALSRERVDVLWVIIRDNQLYQPKHPTAPCAAAA